MTHDVPTLLSGNASSVAAYAALVTAMDSIGSYSVQEKKTSLHIVGSKAAFVGVHPRKQGIRLNVVLARPLESARVVKTERVSANRYHNEIDVKEPADVDADLVRWITEAYER